MPIQKQILQNKAVLITEPIVAFKTCAIGFWFSVGSRYETEKNRGISHFTEHMLFKGTKNKTSLDIARSFDDIGGYVNAFTENEVICLYCVVPSQYTLKVVDIMCEMTEESTFSEEDMQKEKAVIINEILASLDDPEEVALDEVYANIWPNQQISQTISGKVKDVENLTREDLFNWYKKYIANGNLTVCISGNIEENQISQISNKLEKLSYRNDYSNQIKDCLITWNSCCKCIPVSFQQEQVFLLYPIEFPISKKDYLCLSVLNALIGDTMSSRLFQSLREKSGYCYNVYSYFTLFSDCGFWCAYVSTSKKNVKKVVIDLENEIKIILDKGISQNEIDSAIQHLLGEEIINSEDVEQRMKHLARNHFANYESFSSEDVQKMLEQISLSDITSAIKKLLKKENSALVVYGPRLGYTVKKILPKIMGNSINE